MTHGKKLNIPLIKGIVMFVVGMVLSAGTALSGIGPQVAAAPTVHFLLGFTEERTNGTAMAFALASASAAVIGIACAGLRLNFGLAALLFVGATCGALLVARLSQEDRLRVVRRVGQTIGILIGVTVIREALRHRIGGPIVLAGGLLQDNAVVGALVIGVVTGACSGVLQIASGVLLVPSLIYFTGASAPTAIAYSLIVIALASILPTFTYAARQAVDRQIGPSIAIGGILGGASSGLLLGRLAPDSAIPFIVFGVIAMFLSAWQIWRMS